MKFIAIDVALDNTKNNYKKNNVMKRFLQESEEMGDKIVF